MMQIQKLKNTGNYVRHYMLLNFITKERVINIQNPKFFIQDIVSFISYGEELVGKIVKVNIDKMYGYNYGIDLGSKIQSFTNIKEENILDKYIKQDQSGHG